VPGLCDGASVMVGIFSGRLLGLTGGSGDVLGGSGLLGSGSLGRGGEQVYVNATTGNLVLSKQDEFLVGKGPDASVSRTYNSLTTLADDNGDDWRQSSDRRVYGLTGTLNTAGSTVRRVSGDGTEVVYTWNASWRNGSGAYVTTDGSGAYDTIIKSGAEWFWYDGDTSARESYYDETAAAGLQGKIKALKDAAGLAIAYAYDSSNRLSTITTASGESIQYTWAGNNIIQVSTSYTRSAIEETYTQQLYRLYDAAFGRIPDAEGFSSYINFLLSGGKSLSAIADEFYSSSEYQGRGVGSMSNTQFVDFLYNSVLRRAADSNGLSTYVAALDAGQSRGQMLLILSESAEHQTYMTDRGLTAPAKSNTIKTYYSYDSNGRLSVVTTDLTPIGGTLGDGASYATTYGYDAAGHVTSIAQSDGSQLIIEYESTSATARVTKLSETASSGVTRVTGFAYAASTLFSGGVMSSITDPSGQVTVLETDGAGNLRRITAPLIAGAAARQLTQFTYTANGDLASVIDYAGKVTSYGNYTIDGQARTITDTLGNVVTRVFGSIDRTTGAATAYSDAMPYVATDDGSFITDVLLSETSKGVDQSGASINEVTRYVYDKYGGLRYTISPEGRVAEQVRSSGVVVTEVEYPEALYTAAGTPSEADLNAWRDALPDRSSVVKVNYGYDARFNIRQITTYGSYTMTGGGQTTDGSSTTLYAYDQAGQLLSKNASGYNTATYVYDGMGRVKAASDVNGGTTTYVYNDAATTTTITYASGYVVTQTYNKAGDLISQTDSGANTAGGTTSYVYDKLGRVRIRTDAVGGAKTYYVYDNAGRKVGEVDNAGYVTEYRYDSLNRLIGTIRYRNATAFSLTTLADPDAAVVMSAIRPNTPNAQDVSSWTVYDSEDRVLQTIEGDGSVTTMAYDAAGRLQKTTQFANKLSPSTMAGFFVNPPGAFNLVQNATFDGGVWNWLQWGTANITASAGPVLNNGKVQATFRSSTTTDQFALLVDNDIRSVFPAKRLAVSDQMTVSSGIRLARLTINFLNADGNIIGDVDLAQFSSFGSGTVNASGFVDIPDGAVTARLIAWVYSSDAALNTDQTIAVGKPMISIAGTSQTGQPAFSATPNGTPNDSVSRNFYDDDGLLIGTMDGEGYLTRKEYDNAGRLVATTAYANATSSADRASGSWTTLLASVGTSAQDRVTHLVYDGRGLLRFKVDSLNQITTYQYAGNIDKPASVQVYTTALPATSDYTFDNVKRLVFGDTNTTAMTAARTSYNIYDAAGRLSYAIDAAGSVTGYAYDTMGRMTRTVAYATARVTTSQPALNTMDAWSATNISNTANRITRTYYTARGEVAYVVDAQGDVTLTSYDAKGQATSVQRWATPITVDDTTTFAQIAAALTGPSETQSWLYDALGRVTRATDGLGNYTTYIYFGMTTLVRTMTRAANGSVQEQAVTTTTFDGAGHSVQVIEASGASEATTTSVNYDGRGVVASKTDGLSNATSYIYDLDGRVKSITNAAGGVTTYSYNAFGEVWKETDPAGATSYSWYDQLGRVIAVQDAQNYLTTTSYTIFGDVAAITRYMTALTGTPAISTVPAGGGTSAKTSFIYDKLGRVLSSSDALSATESYTYNAFGDRVTSTNKLGAVTTYAYDKIGRLIRQGVAPKNTDGTYAKTANDSATGNYSGGALQSNTVTLGIENATGYSYDGYGNLTQKVEGYATAAGGAVTAMRTTNYIYNAANQLTSVTHDAVTVVADDMVTYSTVTPTETYDYDKRGNVIKSVDAGGAATYTYYDDLDRKKANLRQVATGKWIYTSYAYDANGNLLTTKVYSTAIAATPAMGGTAPTVPSGTWRETNFTYDGLGRMLTSTVVSNSGNDINSGSWNGSSYVTSIGSLTSTYQYDADGNVVKLTDPNNGVTWSWYDKLSRKTAQLDSEGYFTKWTYDAEGNALSETRYATKFTGTPSLSTPPSVSTSGDDRITQFAYDLNGNRLSESRLNVVAWTVNTSSGALAAATTTSAVIKYEYNALGQVVTKSEPTGVSGTPLVQIAGYTYDNTGRLTAETRASFADANGNTVTPTTSYVYDALGDLVTATQTGTSSGTYTAEDRKTFNRYGEGGRLLAATDPEGNVHQYYYDAMGRLKKDAYNRKVNADTTVNGDTAITTTTVAEAQASTYDLAGRVLSQSIYSTVGGTFKRVGLTSYTYNSFDQVLTQGQGSGSSTDISAGSALYQVTNQYDGAGRLVGTNSGDGIWKFFGYDAKGNQTAAITSAGYAFASSTGFAAAQALTSDATYGAQVNGTYTVYDKRGMATQVVEEGRDLTASLTGQTLTTNRIYNAFGEVKTETNARGGVITYTYNTMGRMLRSESPAVAIADETGASYYIKPSEDYYYDLGGRRIAVRDANGSYATTGTTSGTATSKDANTGNLTSLTLLAGTGYDNSQALVSTEFHADAGKKQVLYDIMGDARIVRDELYDSGKPLLHVEERYYNRLGQLIMDKHNRTTNVADDPTRLIDTYVYDQFGQNIQHGNNQQQVVITWNYVGPYYSYQTTTYLTYLDKTGYDALGRVTSRIDASGYVTTNAYAWNGTLATSVNGTNVVFGGWVETDTMANGLTSISKQDIYDREVFSKDLGGHQYNATFDAAGRMITKGGSVYTWYNTGLLNTSAAITGTLGSDTWDRKLSTYGYDKVGNRISEVTVNDGSQLVTYGSNYYSYQSPVGYSYMLVNESATYDALGRLTGMTAAAGTWSGGTTPSATINEYYDAVGNIRRTKSTHALLNSNGAVSGTTTDDYWFRYDSMNRLVTDKGSLSGVAGAANTKIVRAATMPYASTAKAQDYVYDKASQRIAAIRTDYTGASYSSDSGFIAPGYYQETRENVEYDGAGRVSAIKITQGTPVDETYDPSTGAPIAPSSVPIAASSTSTTASRSVFGYDLMGRQTSQTDYDVAGGTVIFSRTANYALNGFLLSDSATTKKYESNGSTSLYTTSSSYSATSSSGQYLLGAVGSVTSSLSKGGSYQNSSSTTNTYQWWDGAVQGTIVYSPDTGSSTTNTTTFNYDVNGTLKSVYIADPRPRTVTYQTNGDGQIIKRDEEDGKTDGDPHEIWYRFAGKELGYIGNNGPLASDLTESSSIYDRQVYQGNGTFRNGSSSAISSTDFAQSTAGQINSYSQSSAAGSYVVQRDGETLRSIAQTLYGDSSLWYEIADANGISGDMALNQGQRLSLPAGVSRTHHNASTLTPYDANSAIGNVAPTTPQPPKKAGCGVLGMIVLAVIAVAVVAVLHAPVGQFFTSMFSGTISGAAVTLGGVTIPAATGTFLTAGGALAASVTTGAVVGAAASIVSQGIGVVTGLQDNFSWKSVGLAALGGAVGGAFGKLNVFGKSVTGLEATGNAMIRGALGNAITQGVGVATGLQDDFDWSGVAGATIGAGLSSQIDASRPVGNALRSMASGLANAASRSVVNGTDFGDNIIATLPDVIANTVGNLVADAVADRGKSKSILERSGQQIESLSETDKAYLASKGITLEATRHGVKVTGLQDARNSLSKDRDAGLIRIGNDNFAIQWADDRTGFLDTGASHVTGVDGGGVQFNFDTSTGRDGFTSDWLTVGDSDAMRFLSRGDQTYLYMGGTERFDALGVTARFGQYISDLPLGDGGGLGFAMDFVVTGGASAVGQLAVAGGRAALMEVVVPLAARAMSPSASRVGLRAGYEMASSTARAADITIPRTILEFGGCFVAGTLVHTPAGLQPIERLQIGDLVLSQPETGGERDARKIVRTVSFGDKAIWQVSYADSSGQTETVHATGNHPFWVEGIGWTAAEFLEPGQLLQLADGSSATVASAHDTGVLDQVFNFEVDGFHTYYVGLQGAWVHNTNCSAGELGRAGELVSSELTGLAKNTSRIPSASGQRMFRVPDHLEPLDLRYIAETKNVSRQSLTSQILDDAAFVTRGGMPGRVDVIIDSRATITGPLLREHLNPGSPIKIIQTNLNRTGN